MVAMATLEPLAVEVAVAHQCSRHTCHTTRVMGGLAVGVLPAALEATMGRHSNKVAAVAVPVGLGLDNRFLPLAVWVLVEHRVGIYLVVVVLVVEVEAACYCPLYLRWVVQG